MWCICWCKCVKCLRLLVVLRRGDGGPEQFRWCILLRTVVCCTSSCLWPAADFHSDSPSPVNTHDECFFTVCTNSPLWNLFTSSCCLLSVIPHSLNKWKKKNNVEMFLLLGFRRLSHNVNQNSTLAWPRSAHPTSGLNSEPNRPGSQFGQSVLQTVPTYSIKTFIWKKFFTAIERGGKKRREVPWSRPFSNPCSGKAIREQRSTQTSRRDEGLEDEWQVSKLFFKGKQVIKKTFTYYVDSLCGRL